MKRNCYLRPVLILPGHAHSVSFVRSFVCSLFVCLFVFSDPMRITKKFAGDSSVGKRVFHPCQRTPEKIQEMTVVQTELEKHERLFLGRLNQRKNGRAVLPSAPGSKLSQDADAGAAVASKLVPSASPSSSSNSIAESSSDSDSTATAGLDAATDSGGDSSAPSSSSTASSPTSSPPTTISAAHDTGSNDHASLPPPPPPPLPFDQQQQQQQQQQQHYFDQRQHDSFAQAWPAHAQHQAHQAQQQQQPSFGSYYPNPPTSSSSTFSSSVPTYPPSDTSGATTSAYGMRRIPSSHRVSWSDDASRPHLQPSTGGHDAQHGSGSTPRGAENDADLLLGFFKEASSRGESATASTDAANPDLVEARKSKGRTWSDVDMVDSSPSEGADGGDEYQRKRRNSEGNHQDQEYAAASMSAIVTG